MGGGQRGRWLECSKNSVPWPPIPLPLVSLYLNVVMLQVDPYSREAFIVNRKFLTDSMWMMSNV